MPNYPYTFQLPPLNVQDIPNDGVAGEFLGINGSGVLDWLPAGGGGTGDMLKADNLSGLASYPTARTNLGLGTGDSPTFANLTLTSPSLSSSAPVTISQTWNAGSNVMTALKVVATDTVSGGTSSLFDARTTAGGSQFSVQKGVVVGDNYSSSTTYGIKTPFVSFGNFYGSGALCGSANGLTLFATPAINAYINIGATLATVGNTNSALAIGAAADTILVRDGVGQLALRNGAAAQTFNVYGTSSASNANYARLALTCGLDGNATISTQALGTGTAGTVSINGVPVGLGKGNVSSNMAIGTTALNVNTTGANNVAIGKDAFSVGAGVFSESVAVGVRALRNASGSSVAIGYDSLGAGGSQSVAVGWGTMNGGTCSDTIGMGWACLYTTQATSVIALGTSSGRFIANGSTANAVSTQSLFIGGLTKANASSETNQIVIGYDATGIGSNSVVLGNDSITKTALKGNVGIGTTAPVAKLHIAGGDASADFNSATIALGFGTTGEYRHFIHTRHAGTAANNFIDFYTSSGVASGVYPTNAVHGMTITNGSVGIGTTSPTSKLHVAGSSSPSITVDNTLATGASQLLFKNTVVTGDTDGIFLNGSTQTGFGGAGSLNIKATTGPIAFHTASVTNALSIAQSGAATFSSSLSVGSWVDCTELRVDGSEVFNTSGATLLVGTGGFSGLNLGAGNVIIRIGGTTNLFPALKRSATTIQARLANDSDFAPIQGKLTTETAFAATTVTPTGFITLYDSTGAAYKVPCVPA